MTQLHYLSSIPSVPIAQLYKHIISGIKPITPCTSSTESIDDTESIWTLFFHTGVYVMAIGLLIPAGLRMFCFLLLLMLTCQISVPTLMTRLYVICYCG